MLFYHTTDQAESILSNGFRDNTGSYMFANLTLTGVFLSNKPVDVNEGAQGDQVLEIAFQSEVDLDSYELVPEGVVVSLREWCVPAALVNENAHVRLMSEVELEDLLIQQIDPEIAAQIRARFPNVTFRTLPSGAAD